MYSLPLRVFIVVSLTISAPPSIVGYAGDLIGLLLNTKEFEEFLKELVRLIVWMHSTFHKSRFVLFDQKERASYSLSFTIAIM